MKLWLLLIHADSRDKPISPVRENGSSLNSCRPPLSYRHPFSILSRFRAFVIQLDGLDDTARVFHCSPKIGDKFIRFDCWPVSSRWSAGWILCAPVISPLPFLRSTCGVSILTSFSDPPGDRY